MIALPAVPGRNGSSPVHHAGPARDPLEYVSASRLKSFLSCRLRFFFEKVLAVPTPTSPSLHFGRAIHAALQAFNKARWRGGDTSEAAVVAAFETAHAQPEGEVQWGEDDPEEMRAKGESLLRAFLAADVHAGVKPMGVEVQVRAELPGVALPILGVLDLVTVGRRVVDYKTCAAAPDLAVEPWLHEIQTTAYALLVEHTTEAPSTGTDLVFLVKTKSPKILVHGIEPPTQTQRDRFAALVEVYATGVANEHYFPQPGMQCGWCAYRAECSRWTGGRP